LGKKHNSKQFLLRSIPGCLTRLPQKLLFDYVPHPIRVKTFCCSVEILERNKDVTKRYKKCIFSIFRGKRFSEPPNMGSKPVFSPLLPDLGQAFWGYPVFLRRYQKIDKKRI
jgi:hypothetical protein